MDERAATPDRDQCARQALDVLDCVLSKRPHADGNLLSTAALLTARLRDRVIADMDARLAAPEGRARLERLNSVISVILAAHFPLGEVPWDDLKAARAWLSEEAGSPT